MKNKHHKRNYGLHCRAVIRSLKRQELLLKEIIMNEKQLLDQINAANAKVEKITGEIRVLKTAVENSKEVSPELAAAAAQLMSNLQVADDENADTEAPATTETAQPEELNQAAASEEQPAEAAAV